MPPPQLPSFHLRSSKFPVLPDEAEELINEGTYGKALAEYIEKQLKSNDLEVPFIVCEDWGWWVEITGQPFSLGCCVYGASHSDTENDLYVTVSRSPGKKWSFRRFRFIDTTERVGSITSTLEAIFTEDSEIDIIDVNCDYPL